MEIYELLTTRRCRIFHLENHLGLDIIYSKLQFERGQFGDKT